MKTSKKQRMCQAIQKHGEQLNAIFNTPYEPIELCKKLRRVELVVNHAAEQYCNGEIDLDQWERVANAALFKLRSILGDSIPFLVNSDPRGYALKIDDKVVRERQLNMHTDFGGYGVIAPDFSGE